MQTIAIHRTPFLPDPDVLANGPVSAAGHVAEDTIKEERGRPSFAIDQVRRILAWKEEGREDRRVDVSDYECWTRKPRRLVYEQLCSLVVAIIGH